MVALQSVVRGGAVGPIWCCRSPEEASMRGSLVVLALSNVLAGLAAVASAQTIYVTTVADKVDFAGAQTVANLPGPDGLVSMREACVAATNTVGPQTIGFQIPAGQWGSGTVGPVLINAGVSFPVNDDFTTIDGTTQTAFTGDTNPNGAEVSFQSTVIDPPLIQSGTIAVRSDHNLIVGLGDMLGRNYGIDLLPQAGSNTISGCVIKGVFAAVRVQGDGNTIGGVAPSAGNRLTSLADGLRIQGIGATSANDNLVFGNFLTGEANGVQITGNAKGNRIGGFGPGERNVISGAGYLQEDGTPDGAMVRIESHENFVLGNLIGTDATGTLAANNVGDVGVEIYGDSNEIRGNVIGGITGTTGFLAVQAGINLREGAANNVIAGNHIGVDQSGAIPIPNHVGVVVGPFDGSLEAPLDNVIGGDAEGDGNQIAHNEEGGIAVLLTSSGTRITRNSIRSNHGGSGIGVDLGGDGATASDLGDVDTGPNGLQNFPVLLSAVSSAQGTVVIGTIDSPSPQNVTIELFANGPAASGETVEAATFLGTATPATDGTFVVLLPTVAANTPLTATATDGVGNTSEISAPHVVSVSPWSDLGRGVAGTQGVPKLVGGGTLASNSKVSLALSFGRPNANAYLVLGVTAVNIPVLAGVLVPSAQFVAQLALDATGSIVLVGDWPGAPTGTTLYAQTLVLDPLAPFSVAFSNAIVGTNP
jgi:hypothetical protein